jgi:Catalase-related immune-responsive
LTQNIANHLVNVTEPFIQQRVIDNFSKVHATFGKMIQEKLAHAATTKQAQRQRGEAQAAPLNPPRDVAQKQMACPFR